MCRRIWLGINRQSMRALYSIETLYRQEMYSKVTQRIIANSVKRVKY